MRLSFVSAFLTAASVASLVSAEPIRVVESANIRFGHALANANVNGNDDSVARFVRPAVIVSPVPQDKNDGISRHFCGASLREKALRLTNAFRHALGLPLIEADVALPRPGHVHILPVGYSSHNVIAQPQEEDGEDGKNGKRHGHKHDNDGDEHHHEHHHHHGHHGRHGHHSHGEHHKSFLRRIHRAIKSLGPWEGRAVAFVLGCGIGVLLRMFWVLSVLAYRTIRGEHVEESLDREYIVYEQVPESLYVAPPQYVDEKVKVEEEEETGERN